MTTPKAYLKTGVASRSVGTIVDLLDQLPADDEQPCAVRVMFDDGSVTRVHSSWLVAVKA